MKNLPPADLCVLMSCGLLSAKAFSRPAYLANARSAPGTLLHGNTPLQGLVEALPKNFLGGLLDNVSNNKDTKSSVFPTQRRGARDLVTSLVQDEKCFSESTGALVFADACADDVIYEDCYYAAKPFVGKEAVKEHLLNKAAQRKGKGDVRLDRISDGASACGFCWTWVSKDGQQEGLRGTTFVELNAQDQISYLREIPEPLFKPGDATLELLKAVTKDATAKPPSPYVTKTPKNANEVAKYLFLDVQGSDIDEVMRLFSESIVYRDFNYEEPLKNKEDVRKFIEDFSFPGITFRPDRFDDGILSTCFTWDVCLEGQDSTIKGISFYELDPDTRLVNYVRDVPESALKPAPLGALARTFRPDLGVFVAVPAGSRPGGM